MVRTVAAIIQEDGKFLLIRRANTSVFEGYWALPGGKIDGDIPRRAVIKEVKEETSLDFNPFYFARYEEHFPQYGWDADTDVFSGSYSGNVRINEEASDFGWFSLEEIEKMDIAFHHRRIIKDFASK